MIRTLGKMWAFVKRDFIEETSYRLAFVLQVFGLLLSVSAFFFVTKMIDPDTPGLDGIDPFPWMLLGISFQYYFSTALYAFASRIRDEQVLGTLEAMLVSPTPTSVVVFASATWDFLWGGLRVILYLVIAKLVFGIPLHFEGLGPLVVGIALTLLSSAGIGILSASFILYFKRGDPINMVISGLTMFFGSVVFPVQQLPQVLQPISQFLPITWSLKVVRGALLKGLGFAELSGELLRLAALTVVLLPAGLFLARIAIRKAKQEGSLVKY